MEIHIITQKQSINQTYAVMLCQVTMKSSTLNREKEKKPTNYKQRQCKDILYICHSSLYTQQINIITTKRLDGKYIT